MAGDWIKMREDLRDSQEVRILSRRMGKCPDTIVGKLHRFWVWAGKTTANGRLADLTEEMLDEICECPGWTNALIAVGWLRTSRKAGYVVPGWEIHNGASAKRRALTARRAAKRRNAGGVTKRARRAEQTQKSEKEDSSSIAARDGKLSESSARRAPEREIVFRTLAGLRSGGVSVFDPSTAAVIARLPTASYEQVCWAIDRLREYGRKKLPDNIGGFLRSLIEKEQPPESWLRRRKRSVSEELQKKVVELSPPQHHGGDSPPDSGQTQQPLAPG
jgi:hypothetical protein